MKPVRMTRLGGTDGDCLMACVASILEITLDDLPTIQESDEENERWFDVFAEALRARGFTVATLSNLFKAAPPGYTIAVGPSHAIDGGGNHHACVALDGDIVHDPHPNGTGVQYVEYWLIPIPLERSPLRLSPSQIAAEV